MESVFIARLPLHVGSVSVVRSLCVECWVVRVLIRLFTLASIVRAVVRFALATDTRWPARCAQIDRRVMNERVHHTKVVTFEVVLQFKRFKNSTKK